MNLLESLAQYLHDQGVGTYLTASAGGSIYLAYTPPSPDTIIALYPTGGLESDAKLGYDMTSFQVRTRGSRDPRTGYNTARAVYDALHGFSGELPDNQYVVLIRGIQSGPVSLGPDENHRMEYTINFEVEARALTAHRE